MQNHMIKILKSLRDEIIAHFEAFEPKKRFERTLWTHPTGGGGEMSVIRGDFFEKAAVNWSAISGTKLPVHQEMGPFFATGISLITHMRNPKAPTVHMNMRYIKTKNRFWFGGGYDLTPMGFPHKEDSEHFHTTAKNALDPHGEELYPLFSQNAKEYFYIKHRKKERGIGGIFFDNYNTGDFEKDLAMWHCVGSSFLATILPIYKRRIPEPFTEEDRKKQGVFRAHYAEFNLLYDRGTKFGFLSGGNPEAILCSMPPTATW